MSESGLFSPEPGMLFFVIFSLILAVVGSAEFNNCASNLNELEKALFDAGNNAFELNSVFFPPSQRPTRFITVKYSFGTDGDCDVTYIWAIGAFLFLQPPTVFKFASLYFNHPNNDLTFLNLELPSECRGVVFPSEDNTSCSCAGNTPLLDILTQQLDVYAAYTCFENVMREHSFARATCAEDLEGVYYASTDSRFVFVFVCTAILLPLSLLLIFFIVIRNTKSDAVNSFAKPSNHSTLVSLVLVGIVFSVGILVCDVLACHSALSPNHEFDDFISTNSLNLRITIATLILDIIFVIPLLVSLIYIFYHNIKLFFGIKKHFVLSQAILQRFTAFVTGVTDSEVRKKLSDDDVITVILPLMLLPPLFCIFSHLGYILLAWLTEPAKASTQLLLMYIIAGYLFLAFKKLYSLNSKFDISLGKKESESKEVVEDDDDGIELKDMQVEVRPDSKSTDDTDASIGDVSNNGQEKSKEGKGETSLNISFKAEKKYINTQAFCLVFFYGLFVVGIGAMVILMFLLLPLASEEIVVYLFNILQLVIVIVSMQVAYQLLFSSEFNIDELFEKFRSIFAKKEITSSNKNVVTIARDKEATNAETAGVMAAELANSLLK